MWVEKHPSTIKGKLNSQEETSQNGALTAAWRSTRLRSTVGADCECLSVPVEGRAWWSSCSASSRNCDDKLVRVSRCFGAVCSDACSHRGTNRGCVLSVETGGSWRGDPAHPSRACTLLEINWAHRGRNRHVLVRQFQEPLTESIVEHHASSVREFRELVSDWTFQSVANGKAFLMRSISWSSCDSKIQGRSDAGNIWDVHTESAMASHDVVRIDGEGLRLVSVLEASRS